MTFPMFTDEGPQYYSRAYAHNRPFATAGPYITKLSPEDEAAFQAWVKSSGVEFREGVSDYDLRGWWKENRPTGKPAFFNDKYKTPYDTDFSNESIYATSNCPFRWKDDATLIDIRDGSTVFFNPAHYASNPAGPTPMETPPFAPEDMPTPVGRQQGGPAGIYAGAGSVEANTPGSREWLAAQLSNAGLSRDQIRGILAMNAVEGGETDPQSILGFTESQAQGPYAHVRAFLDQWNDMSRRPGGKIPGMVGGTATDWNAYMTWIREKIVGQTGSTSDWQGAAQPAAQDYQNRLMSAVRRQQGGPASPYMAIRHADGELSRVAQNCQVSLEPGEGMVLVTPNGIIDNGRRAGRNGATVTLSTKSR